MSRNPLLDPLDPEDWRSIMLVISTQALLLRAKMPAKETAPPMCWAFYREDGEIVVERETCNSATEDRIRTLRQMRLKHRNTLKWLAICYEGYATTNGLSANYDEDMVEPPAKGDQLMKRDSIMVIIWDPKDEGHPHVVMHVLAHEKGFLTPVEMIHLSDQSTLRETKDGAPGPYLQLNSAYASIWT